MHCRRIAPRTWSSLLGALLACTFIQWTQALSMAYCSSLLVGATNELTSIYMSTGACQGQCQSSYAFAIIQGDSCWCSNTAPGTSVSTTQCNDPCPGFPSDLCGNTLNNLYSYYVLGRAPSGTSGGSSSAAPSSISTSTSTSTTTPFSSSSSPTQAPSSSVSSSASLATESPSSAALSTSGPTTSAPTMSVYTSVITQTGRATTIIVTQAPASTDSSLGNNSSGTTAAKSSGLSGGAVAGIVIGIAIILLLIGAIFFWAMRRRHQRNIDELSNPGGFMSSSSANRANNAGENGAPSRQVSQMSSAGLLTRPNRVGTSAAASTIATDPRSAGAGTHSSDRNSTHMTVDQRLNPWAIYSNEESRISNVSLQDNHDYSRQLRVANPDA